LEKNLKGLSHLNSWKIPDQNNSNLNGTEFFLKFSEIFWKIWSEVGFEFPPENWNRCYLFEVLHPLTVNVVPYQKEKGTLILHGCRDLTTLKEIPPEEVAAQCGWLCIQSQVFPNMETLITHTLSQDPTHTPGLILCDPTFRRTNVLSPQYTALRDLHPWNDKNRNFRLMLDLVRTNRNYSFIHEYFPEWKFLFLEVLMEFEEFCGVVQKVYDLIWNVDGAMYAREANKYAFYGILFQIRKEGCVVRDIRLYFTTLRLQWLISCMKGWKEGRKRDQ